MCCASWRVLPTFFIILFCLIAPLQSRNFTLCIGTTSVAFWRSVSCLRPTSWFFALSKHFSLVACASVWNFQLFYTLQTLLLPWEIHWFVCNAQTWWGAHLKIDWVIEVISLDSSGGHDDTLKNWTGCSLSGKLHIYLHTDTYKPRLGRPLNRLHSKNWAVFMSALLAKPLVCCTHRHRFLDVVFNPWIRVAAKHYLCAQFLISSSSTELPSFPSLSVKYLVSSETTLFDFLDAPPMQKITLLSSETCFHLCILILCCPLSPGNRLKKKNCDFFKAQLKNTFARQAWLDNQSAVWSLYIRCGCLYTLTVTAHRRIILFRGLSRQGPLVSHTGSSWERFRRAGDSLAQGAVNKSSQVHAGVNGLVARLRSRFWLSPLFVRHLIPTGHSSLAPNITGPLAEPCWSYKASSFSVSNK